LRRAKQQLSGMLRRFGLRYNITKTKWTKSYWKWLHRINFSDSCLQIIFIDYLDEIERIEKIKARLDKEIIEMNQQWSKQPIVEAITTLKGVGEYGAICIVAEVGRFSRFETASKFMGYLGLTPCEYSSGTRVTRGKITKMGNSRIRCLLIEGAQSYRRGLNKTGYLRSVWKEKPTEYVDHAWKAQKRLFGQFWSLVQKGKNPNVATVAVARELAGFIWAIGCMEERRLLNQKVA